MIMLTTLLLTACGGSIKKDIIGGWKAVIDGDTSDYYTFDEERMVIKGMSDDSPESLDYILTETDDDHFILEFIIPENGYKEFLFEGYFENRDTIKVVDSSSGDFEFIRVDNIEEDMAEEKKTQVEQEKETEGEIVTSEPLKGDIAPDFELKTIDVEIVKLSAFRGRKIFLNFWASWAPPSRAEMPDLQKLHENKDVVILAVDLLETEKQQDTESVEEFIEEYGITFNVLLDEESIVSETYGVKPVPTTFMIDSEGIVQSVAFGALNYELMLDKLDEMD